ncbi:hypothetical protein ACGF07_11190 [Kitasatospora sp. NPDC048194]|uniref:hypothetical protein n=1 Tax=Kitasatospora sp. NPDC048194 TaxID=3364045 RepID=UPI00371DCC5C
MLRKTVGIMALIVAAMTTAFPVASAAAAGSGSVHVTIQADGNNKHTTDIPLCC